MAKFLGRCRNGLTRILAGLWQYRLSVAMVSVAIAGVGLAVSHIDPLEWRLSSAAERADREDLVAIGEALREYSSEDKHDRYPPAMIAPEFGLPDLVAMKGYLSPHLVERLRSTSKPRVCYLGYFLVNDYPAMKLFGRWQTQGLATDLRSDVNLGAPDSGGAENTTRTEKSIPRFCVGLERLFIREIGLPASGRLAQIVQKQIPVLWEMPSSERPGGYVLCMDGHVEWAAYPGVFPMSEAAVAALRQFIDEPGVAFTLPSPSPILEQARAFQMAMEQNAPTSPLAPYNGPLVLRYDATPSTSIGGAPGYRVTVGTMRSTTMARCGVEVRELVPWEEVVLGLKK